MANQIYLLRRKYLEWLSSHLNCLHQAIFQREWVRTLIYEPYFLEISRWEIGKGGFAEHRGIGAAEASWGLFTCWTKKLQNAWGLSVWIGKFNLVVWTGYVLLVHDKEKKDFSCSLRFLHRGEHVWSAIWGMENPCNESGFRENEVAHGMFSHNCMRSLVRK